MKIRKLVVKNFRGIKELDWNLPNENIFCLIGKGDSSKSTILDAIKLVFLPQWNPTLSDSDFYLCQTTDPIIIEATIGDLVEDFCSLTKYGHFMRGWDINKLQLSDEPDDGLENVLTVRLTVANDLEPKWRVICERTPEGAEFKVGDRGKACVELIGAYSERQLSWAQGTALAKLTERQKLNESLANASRSARSSLDSNRAAALKNLDEAAQKAEAVAKMLGVPVTDKYKAHLDLSTVNIKIGGLALHDGDVPLRQLGLGSRRILLCGIQKQGLEAGHITLIDEIEFGLEPHRITRLIKHIRDDKSGQYFLTTHSPTVLRELGIKDLHIVHSTNGNVQIIPASGKNLEEYEIQGKIRSSAEAFLSKKVVICEGATEVGFLRGLDDHYLEKGKDPLSFHGVALLDVKGGSKVKAMAKAFHSLCYEVAIVADLDVESQFSQNDANELAALGIQVKVWSENLAIEQRAMLDLPWPLVIACTKLARDEFSYPIRDNIVSKLQKTLDDDIDKWVETQELRKAIGDAAKASAWFKDTTRGDLWFKSIAPAFDEKTFCKTDLAVKLNELWTWAENV